MREGLLLVGNYLSGVTGTRSVCEDLSDRFQESGSRVIRTSSRSGKAGRISDMVWTTITRRKDYAVGIVEVYSGNAFIWAETVCRFLRMLRKPYVLTLHGGGLVDFASRNAQRVAGLLRKAAVVTTPSRFLQKELNGIRADILYLPNALSVSDYPFRLRERPSPKLAWLRAFHAMYNPLMAVRAVDRLRSKNPDIHLTMYGPDKGDGSLQQVQGFIREHGLANCVAIPGAVPKKRVPEILSEHDLFLNTTTLESFGVCVIEAAACGLPVVSTAVGEIPHLWRDREDALLVPTGDDEAMAEAIQRLLDEPDLAARISRNARGRAEQFDWSIVLPQWERLLTTIGKT